MSTHKGKWLLAGVMAVSTVIASESASADYHGGGYGATEAVVTGLAIGVVAASLIDNGRHGHHEEYREVHNYYNYAPPRRYCPPRVRVVHEYDYDDYRDRHHHDHGRHHGYGHGYYVERERSVIVNHY